MRCWRTGPRKCWGYNHYGQLGNGTDDELVDAGCGERSVVGVEGDRGLGGRLHSCALLANGTAKCWGDNMHGELGNGTLTDSSTPVAVSGLPPRSRSRRARFHTCALLANGTAKCWGSNVYGQLGTAPLTASPTPVLVSGLTRRGRNSAGSFGGDSCALLANGTARCWGFNGFGQLGNGTNQPLPGPLGSVSTTAIRRAASRSRYRDPVGTMYSCARLATGTVKCWGRNSAGRWGMERQPTSTPVAVSGLFSAVAISAGAFHVCALLATGTAKCWGDNTIGQLGNGNVPHALPVVVIGLVTVAAIAAGTNHSCVVLGARDGQVLGGNDLGQLGNGTTSNFRRDAGGGRRAVQRRRHFGR